MYYFCSYWWLISAPELHICLFFHQKTYRTAAIRVENVLLRRYDRLQQWTMPNHKNNFRGFPSLVYIFYVFIVIGRLLVQIPAPLGWVVEVSLSEIVNPSCSWGPCDELATCPGCPLPSPGDSWDRLQQQTPRPLETGIKQLHMMTWVHRFGWGAFQF